MTVGELRERLSEFEDWADVYMVDLEDMVECHTVGNPLFEANQVDRVEGSHAAAVIYPRGDI